MSSVGAVPRAGAVFERAGAVASQRNGALGPEWAKACLRMECRRRSRRCPHRQQRRQHSRRQTNPKASAFAHPCPSTGHRLPRGRTDPLWRRHDSHGRMDQPNKTLTENG
jgi:hypothetical protein